LQLRDLLLDGERPYIHLRPEITKSRRDREPALNELGLWSVQQLLARARLLGASQPSDYLLPADLSKHTKKTDPLRGGRGFDPARHQTSWNSAWEKLKKAAGLESFRFHDLRHTHITRVIEAGVPIEVVMAQVGHISPEMTRYYTHIGADSKHSAVTALQEQSVAVLAALRQGEATSDEEHLPSSDRHPKGT